MAISPTLPSTFSKWAQKKDSTKYPPLSSEVSSNLVLENHPTPTSLPSKAVLVRIKACSLNYRDLLTIGQSDIYPTPLKAGNSPLSDGVGEVVAVGDGSRWAIGEKVILSPNTWLEGPDERDWNFEGALGGYADGALSEMKVVEDHRLVPMPKTLSYEEAACMPNAGATAYRALFGEVEGQGNRLREGDWVLTQGTGGVSLWAVQLAAAAGANVIATSSSNSKLDFARKLGAKHTINYRTHRNWEEEVLRITNGRGVDRVVEVGGSSTMMKSLKSTRFGGHVVLIGVLAEGDENGVTNQLLFGAKTIKGHLGTSADTVRQLGEFVERHGIHPVIGESFRFEESQDAVRALQAQKTVGKIVITV